MVTTETKCSAQVFDGWICRPCSKGAVVEHDGNPYCKIHDPKYIEEKIIKRNARWKAEWDAEKRESKLLTAISACREINPSNPQAVAENILAMYGALRKIIPLIESFTPFQRKRPEVAGAFKVLSAIEAKG